MFLTIEEKRIEFPNNQEQIDIVISSINEYLQLNGLKLSYLLIDGTVVRENILDYLLKNISDINNIEVIIFNPEEIVVSTLVMTYNYLKSAIPLIKLLAEDFYRKPDEKAWISLNDLFEGLQWIIESLHRIDRFGNLENVMNNYEIWNEYVQSVSVLSTVVPQLEQVLTENDYVSIGDLLLYEVAPVFDAMLERLIFLLPKLGEDNVS